jgi:hypothetical protein
VCKVLPAFAPLSKVKKGNLFHTPSLCSCPTSYSFEIA